VQRLERKTRVLFYEDTTWFTQHRLGIKRFVAWCDDTLAGDYYLTKDTVYNYLEYSIQTKKDELIAAGVGFSADEFPAVIVFNHIRVVVAMLERLALWQVRTWRNCARSGGLRLQPSYCRV
jgi:hypothetical protein